MLLSLLGFSCEEEEERLTPQLRLAKTSIYSTYRTEPYMTHVYGYNGRGLLTNFDRYRLYYSKNDLLTSVSDEGMRETFSYDAKGNLTEVSRSFPPNPNRPSSTFTFEHDAQGRITRVNIKDGGATLLTYDASGNVIKQEGYYTSLYTGELGFRSFLLEVTYDTKRNPFQGLGASISHYGCPLEFTNARGWNFISYLSPNNPIELKLTRFDNSNSERVEEEVIPLVYTYNLDGLPVEIRFDEFWQKLEYDML